MNQLTAILSRLADVMETQQAHPPVAAHINTLLSQSASMAAVLEGVARDLQSVTKTVVEHDRWIMRVNHVLESMERRITPLESHAATAREVESERRGSYKTTMTVVAALSGLVSAIVSAAIAQFWRQ
jgi:hypothetical protein